MKMCWNVGHQTVDKTKVFLWHHKKLLASFQVFNIQEKNTHTRVLSQYENIKKLILENTEITSNHMTPELKLHLITPKCKLWWSKGDNSPFNDPYWAFYWPGGQVISRYILDNRRLFEDKCVLDVGAGCGASAIAAIKSGAKIAISNDVDEVAGTAATMNAKLNNASIQIDTRNLIGHSGENWDVVLLGDMFYDSEFADAIGHWVRTLLKNGTTVFVGDPGRLPLETHPMKTLLTKVAEYKLPAEITKENNGFTIGTVWKLNR